MRVLDLETLETYGPINPAFNDLATWFTERQSVGLQISSSRLDHYLVVLHPDGSRYPITNGADAGTTSAPPGLPSS